MSLKDIASQLDGIARALVEMMAEQERQQRQRTRWTIRGYRRDHDWEDSLWFTDVYAIDEPEVWSQVAWLAKTFEMSLHDVSVFPGKTEEYKQWEQGLLKS